MQEPDADLAELTQRYGWRRARRIWQLSLAATSDFVDTLTRLRIKCDLVRRDSVYYTTDRDEVPRLRDEHRRRLAAGLDVRWLEGAALRRIVGFDAAAAIRTRGNAQVDPFKACIGLMRAAARAGAQVFERSPVTAIRPSSRDVRRAHRRAARFAPTASSSRPATRRRISSRCGAVPHAQHLRRGDQAADAGAAAPHRAGRGDAVGHGTAVSLRPLDAAITG